MSLDGRRRRLNILRKNIEFLWRIPLLGFTIVISRADPSMGTKRLRKYGFVSIFLLPEKYYKTSYIIP
jgi:hypothetical protein